MPAENDDVIHLVAARVEGRSPRNSSIFGIQNSPQDAVEWLQEKAMSHPPLFAVAVAVVLALASAVGVYHSAQHPRSISEPA
jgi:hypothetical protein